jgi:predicted Abi (CAAX) family protease
MRHTLILFILFKCVNIETFHPNEFSVEFFKLYVVTEVVTTSSVVLFSIFFRYCGTGFSHQFSDEVNFLLS